VPWTFLGLNVARVDARDLLVVRQLGHERPSDGRHWPSQLHVEAARLQYDARSGDRARDRQCLAVQGPRHAQCGRARRDVALLELREETFEFLDNFKT
jgi:hypothetical protein